MTLLIENIRKAYTLYRHDAITSAKKCVEEGGGIWAGIQEGTENISAAVMFHSPKTRTTLGLRLSEITAEAVAEKIRNSDATFEHWRKQL